MVFFMFYVMFIQKPELSGNNSRNDIKSKSYWHNFIWELEHYKFYLLHLGLLLPGSFPGLIWKRLKYTSTSQAPLFSLSPCLPASPFSSLSSLLSFIHLSPFLIFIITCFLSPLLSLMNFLIRKLLCTFWRIKTKIIKYPLPVRNTFSVHMVVLSYTDHTTFLYLKI